MKRAIADAATLLCVAIALWGCGGTPAPTRYYVLNPSRTTSPASADVDGPSVELGRVMLPEYLNQAAILTRDSGNEVQRAAYDLWAGPLTDEVTRTLGENLSLDLPTDRLSLSGGRLSAPADFIVDVEIVSFERDATDTVQLVARWSVFREDGKALVAIHRTAYRQRAVGAEYAATVAAMSRALGELSLEIADTINKNKTANANITHGGAVEARSAAGRSKR